MPRRGPEAAWRKATISRLLCGRQAGGGFGVDPYAKWRGAHWRLVSLVEQRVAKTSRAAHAAANHVLDWLVTPAALALLS
ncbi:MAG TPA: hypothetical protein VJT78_13700 [Candidatus Dormibacteraeota bacterium]|nr:hypothetical protein [Candidatus Dormibacteraeota bacterium]